ncbi:nonsense-mediated mRNA decay factor SMG5-like [Tachypleus tridentatus]|uniref:nonsense-mediated mRNA decay factor SMG5-like n=1 Tax=Tachypleus tridentatus TaxID=6853 RepID=UPI003FD489C4
MMWNMAHLWLKAEVNDLESKVKGGGFPQLSPYLVPDISSFCQHLALSKQLRLSKRFVIVVPSVGYGNEEEVWIGDLLASQGKHARAQQELAAQGYFVDNIDVEVKYAYSVSNLRLV